jgi:hypothetical protein
MTPPHADGLAQVPTAGLESQSPARIAASAAADDALIIYLDCSKRSGSDVAARLTSARLAGLGLRAINRRGDDPRTPWFTVSRRRRVVNRGH